MIKHKNLSIKKILKTISHSLRGLKATFINEMAFRLEIVVLSILVPLAFVLDHNIINSIFLISSWLLVIIIELINTAIEAIVDRIGLEYHHLSAKAKDIGSAAVFVSVINAAIIWLIFIIKFVSKLYF